MECFSMKREIRQNHAEHENGNCSSHNRAEHEIRQNRAEPKLDKIMLNTKLDKITLNTKMGTVVPKIVLNMKSGSQFNHVINN